MSNEIKNYNKGGDEYFGPEDELTLEDIEECKKIADRNVIERNGLNQKLNLMKDDEILQVAGQEIALVSFIGPYDYP